MVAIAFTVSCRRRAYLDRTLRSWARVRGISDVPMVLCLEHYHPFRRQEQQHARLEREEFDGFEGQLAQLLPRAAVIRHRSRQGCVANTRFALEQGFALSDFVVLAEEDIEVADDVLEYFTWASQYFREDPGVLAVCAHSIAAVPAEASLVTLRPWFTPLVWGTWRDRWDALLAPGWQVRPGFPDGWDYFIRDMMGPSLKCVYPAMSRSQHFGSQSTLTPRSPATGSTYFHDRSQSKTFWERYAPQEFRAGIVDRLECY